MNDEEARQMAAQALQQIAVHEGQCGERWKSADEKMGAVQRTVSRLDRRATAEDAARSARQKITDKQHKQMVFWLRLVVGAFTAVGATTGALALFM